MDIPIRDFAFTTEHGQSVLRCICASGISAARSCLLIIRKETAYPRLAHSGQDREVELLVMAWGASQYIYAEGQESQRLPDWIMGHRRGYEYFGCAPHIEVDDNLKSAVSKACRYDPDVNITFAEFARHYGVAIIPARPRKPKDKPKVENAVLLAQRWILACLRNRVFYSIRRTQPGNPRAG